MYIKTSVPKAGGIAPGAAAAKDPNVTIVDIDDILYFPVRDSKGIVMLGDFVLKPNARMVQIYMTKSKISAPYEGDGDEDSQSIKQSFEGQHPGNKKEIREFIQNWLGKNVVVIHGSCSETEREVVGTKCAPLQLKPSKQDNNDGRFHMLKFEAFAKSAFLPGLYNGNLVLDAPAVVTDVAAISVDAEGDGLQYKLPALAVTDAIEFDSIVADDRSLVTLIGGGGVAPATLPQGVAGAATVVLAGGVTWTALDQSTITLQYVDAGGTVYLIEQSRS